MRDQELVNAIRRLKVETGSLACMGCGHEHNCGVSGCAVMREAADRIANQSTHILALQKEIAGLRKAVRWVHDGLYLCDPEKNTVCKKSGCKKQCFHTTFPAFADAWAETPAPQLRWIPVEERLPEKRSTVIEHRLYGNSGCVTVDTHVECAKLDLCLKLKQRLMESLRDEIICGEDDSTPLGLSRTEPSADG